MRACVVIPTYNEFENIDEIISRLLAHDSLDVLIVDDSSPDGTGIKVEEWEKKTNGRVRLHTRKQKQGLGRAYLDGFALAIADGYEIICQMDADLSHDPDVINNLINPIFSKEADAVLGSRYIQGGSIPNWSWHRKFLSRFGNLYARTALGLFSHDATGGYRAYSAPLLEKLIDNSIRADGYGFQIEMTYLSCKLGAKIVEVPIAFTDRVRGESKMSFRIVVEALLLVTWWSLRDLAFIKRRKKPSHARYCVVDTTIKARNND